MNAKLLAILAVVTISVIGGVFASGMLTNQTPTTPALLPHWRASEIHNSTFLTATVWNNGNETGIIHGYDVRSSTSGLTNFSWTNRTLGVQVPVGSSYQLVIRTPNQCGPTEELVKIDLSQQWDPIYGGTFSDSIQWDYYAPC